MKKKEINYGFIYLFKVSGKGYVGQTPYLKERVKDHFKEKRYNSYFHNSLRKHFKENGSFKILECWKRNGRSLEEFRKLLNACEMFWISELKTFDPKQENGWNLTKGGDGVLGRIRSKESIEKISGKKHPRFGKPWPALSEHNKQRVGAKNPNWGKHWPEKTLKLKSGINHPHTKFTESQIREIRISPLKGVELAKIYNTTPTTISRIKSHKSWKYLDK